MEMYLPGLSIDGPILSKSEEWVFVFDRQLRNTTTKGWMTEGSKGDEAWLAIW